MTIDGNVVSVDHEVNVWRCVVASIDVEMVPIVGGVMEVGMGWEVWIVLWKVIDVVDVHGVHFRR